MNLWNLQQSCSFTYTEYTLYTNNALSTDNKIFVYNPKISAYKLMMYHKMYYNLFYKSVKYRTENKMMRTWYYRVQIHVTLLPRVIKLTPNKRNRINDRNWEGWCFFCNISPFGKLLFSWMRINRWKIGYIYYIIKMDDEAISKQV